MIRLSVIRRRLSCELHSYRDRRKRGSLLGFPRDCSTTRLVWKHPVVLLRRCFAKWYYILLRDRGASRTVNLKCALVKTSLLKGSPLIQEWSSQPVAPWHLKNSCRG